MAVKQSQVMTDKIKEKRMWLEQNHRAVKRRMAKV
jgi:hypothetical protein